MDKIKKRITEQVADGEKLNVDMFDGSGLNTILKMLLGGDIHVDDFQDSPENLGYLLLGLIRKRSEELVEILHGDNGFIALRSSDWLQRELKCLISVILEDINYISLAEAEEDQS